MRAGSTCSRCGAPHYADQPCAPDWPAPPDVAAAPAAASQAGPLATDVRRRSHAALRVARSVVGASVALVALVAAMSTGGLLIAALTRTSTDVGPALAAVFAATVGIVFGAVLLYACARFVAKICYSVLAVFLITAGALMVALAPAVRQMDAPGVADDRSLVVLSASGAASLLAGLLLAALCLRWATRPAALRTLGRWARLLGSAYGVLLGIVGAIGMLSLVSVSNGAAGSAGAPQRAIETTAIAMFSFVPGLILTYHGISASMDERSGPWRPPVAAGRRCCTASAACSRAGPAAGGRSCCCGAAARRCTCSTARSSASPSGTGHSAGGSGAPGCCSRWRSRCTRSGTASRCCSRLGSWGWTR